MEQPQEKETPENELKLQFFSNFSSRNNVRTQIQFRRERQPSILKDDFSSRTDPSIFTSIEPLLLDYSTKPAEFSQH